MANRRHEMLRRIYRMFEGITPLSGDCGSLCGARCCQGGDRDGMWLLPGEEEILKNAGFLELHRTEDHTYVVCAGRCDRELRPIACRIFPYFPVPYRTRTGRFGVRAMPDVRALSTCALFEKGAPSVSPAFRRAVRRAGIVMLRDRRLRRWLRESGDFLQEIARVRALLDR